MPRWLHCFHFIRMGFDEIYPLNLLVDNNENFTNLSFCGDEIVIPCPVYAAAFSILMVLGITANSYIVLYTATHRKARKVPTFVFLFGLSLSHLIGCLVFPFPLITSAAGKWIFGETVLERKVFCRINSFFLSFPLTTSYCIIALISFDRFLFISQSIKYNVYMTVKRATVLQILTAVGSFLYIAFGGGQMFISFPNFSCIPSLGRKGQGIKSMIFMSSVAGVIILFTVMTCISTRQFIVRDHKRRLSNSTSKEAEDFEKDIYISRTCNLFGIFGMLLLLYGSVFIPYYTMIFAFRASDDVPHDLYSISFMFLLSLHVSSPIVQSYFRKDLKSTLRRLLCLCSNTYKK